MVVKNIFKDVKYPEDKKKIEHIIKQYDIEMDNLLRHSETKGSKDKSGMYIILIISIISILYMFKFSWVSLIIRAIYIIPPILFILYYSGILLNAKKEKIRNAKLNFKIKILNIVFLCMFLYVSTFMIETMFLYKRWGDKEYLISFFTLFIACLIVSIISAIKAPEKFIRDYQYKTKKKVTPSAIAGSITALLVSLAYFNKPYKLILIGAYIMLIILSAIMTYRIFEYTQYDKIQELKKKINYVPSNE